jgi:hypothetical protein
MAATDAVSQSMIGPAIVGMCIGIGLIAAALFMPKKWTESPTGDWSMIAAVLSGVFLIGLAQLLGIVAMLFGAVTAGLAKKRGQPPIKWWIIGSWFPLIALIYAWLYMEDKTKKQCNFCRELVDKSAIVCPRCGHDPYGFIETAPRP